MSSIISLLSPMGSGGGGNKTYVVNSEAEMLALDALVGDIAIRTDESKTYVLKEYPPGQLSNWQELAVPVDKVLSVNSKQGEVVLTTTDIDEGTNLYYTQARFDSAFGAKSTTDLSEGTNLYYTDARAIAAVEGASFTSLTADTVNAGNIKIASNQIETTGTNDLIFQDSNNAIRFIAKTETQFRCQGVDGKSVLFGMSADGTHGFCWAVHHGVNFLPLRIQTGSELLVGVEYDNNSSDKLQVLGNCSVHGGDYKVADATGNSNTTVIDSARAATFTKLNVDNVQIDGDIISNTDTNGNVEITPNGTGVARLNSNAVLAAPTSAIADATLGNSQLHPWLDEANSILKFKVKNSSGAVSTYEVGGSGGGGDGTFDNVRITDGGTLKMDVSLPDENYFTFNTYKTGELSDKLAIKLNFHAEAGGVLADSLIAGTQTGNLGINQADPRANLHTTGSTILGLQKVGNILDADIGQYQAWIYRDSADDIIKLRYRDDSEAYHDYYINKHKTGQDLLQSSSVTFGSVSAGTLTSTGTISASGAVSADSVTATNAITGGSIKDGTINMTGGIIAPDDTTNGNIDIMPGSTGTVNIDNLRLRNSEINVPSGHDLNLKTTNGTVKIESVIWYTAAGTTADAANLALVSGTDLIRVSTSSRRYKSNITDIEIDTSKVFNLRPASYNSTCDDDDKSKRLFGLIAEEVAEEIPELVTFNKDGLPQSVKYPFLPVVMLNEVKKMNSRLEKLERKFFNNEQKRRK